VGDLGPLQRLVQQHEQLAVIRQRRQRVVAREVFSRPLAQVDLIAALPTVEQRSRALLSPTLVQQVKPRHRGDDAHGQLVSAVDRLAHRVAPRPTPPRI